MIWIQTSPKKTWRVMGNKTWFYGNISESIGSCCCHSAITDSVFLHGLSFNLWLHSPLKPTCWVGHWLMASKFLCVVCMRCCAEGCLRTGEEYLNGLRFNWRSNWNWELRNEEQPPSTGRLSSASSLRSVRSSSACTLRRDLTNHSLR